MGCARTGKCLGKASIGPQLTMPPGFPLRPGCSPVPLPTVVFVLQYYRTMQMLILMSTHRCLQSATDACPFLGRDCQLQKPLSESDLQPWSPNSLSRQVPWPHLALEGDGSDPGEEPTVGRWGLKRLGLSTPAAWGTWRFQGSRSGLLFCGFQDPLSTHPCGRGGHPQPGVFMQKSVPGTLTPAIACGFQAWLSHL